jgi:hypothetical protein
MEIKKTSFDTLGSFQKDFLVELVGEFPFSPSDPGIPVYSRWSDGFSFITNFILPTRANKKFEKEAPEGLFRGGAVIKVVCSQGICVVPDERHGWFKPFAGIARHSEGHNLCLAGARELLEEAFVYDLQKTTRFVPGDHLDAPKNCTLNFTVERTIEIGEINLLGYEINETNRALESVLEWDITGIRVPFSISLEEKWWAGGNNGVSVYAINPSGELIGVFSGQQGFIEIPKYGVHETLQKYL